MRLSVNLKLWAIVWSPWASHANISAGTDGVTNLQEEIDPDRHEEVSLLPEHGSREEYI